LLVNNYLIVINIPYGMSLVIVGGSLVY
jgi:hypothetical protein